jgi:hypothetical protein
MVSFRIGEFKNVCAVRLENFVLTELTKLVKELVVENAVKALADFIQVFPFVRN